GYGRPVRYPIRWFTHYGAAVKPAELPPAVRKPDGTSLTKNTGPAGQKRFAAGLAQPYNAYQSPPAGASWTAGRFPNRIGKGRVHAGRVLDLFVQLPGSTCALPCPACKRSHLSLAIRLPETPISI